MRLERIDFYNARSVGVGDANDGREVACNKPEAQAKGIECSAF